MTSDRKAGFSLTVRQAGPGRFRCGSRVLLLIGVLLALTAPGGAARAMQGPPDWVEDLIREVPPGSVTERVFLASHVSRAEAHEYLERLGLERLGLDGGALLDPEVSIRGSDAFHGVLEARADWAAYRLELNGKFASRQFTEVLGQAMTVTAVISSDGLRISDDRGGSRTEAYRRFPLDACDRGSERGGCADPASFYATFDEASDDHGTIAEVVRDSQGLPIGVRFGESLLLRYKFTPPLPAPPGSVQAGGRWREPSSWELIDLRTSEIVIDSVDAARVASERPRLSVGLRGVGGVLRFEGGAAFAVPGGVRWRSYALLPLETTSDIWRIVHASGGRSRNHQFRVHYTDDLVRARIRIGEGDRSIVVEAPRRRESLAPVSFVHPGAEMLTDAMRSGIRLRTAEPLDAWLDGAFEKERLPIVLRPFHFEGLVPSAVRFGLIEVQYGSIGELPRREHHLQFGPADGCEEKDQGIVCSGGVSDVIGEENSPDPWRVYAHRAENRRLKAGPDRNLAVAIARSVSANRVSLHLTRSATWTSCPTSRARRRSRWR